MARTLRARTGFVLRWACPCGALLAALSVPTSCTAATAAIAEPSHPYAASVAEASQRFGIPERWIWRVMHAESRGNRRAVSRAGAMGLMQIMPPTWAMLSARHRLGNDPFDVRANILAGAAYLRAMWDRYRDVRLMLAAYNAGPGRADAYAAGRRRLPAETLAYVHQIAPELGTSDGPPSVPAPALAAPGWRDASLFAARPQLTDTAETRTVAAPTLRDEAAPPPVRTMPVAPSNPLFVPLSGPAE